ncbi:hypothetical protein [Fulvivirga sp.]|uniref:hypothetical protein n=1 Tax=Fulvivirga sp. TaxID=1931237 RepID=UPI0032EBB18A
MNDTKPPIFTGNVSLLPGDASRFQFVYATQLYHSFFCAYARISADINQNEALIKKIEFRGLTYKGCLNLKIVKVELDSTSELEGLNIKMTLQGDTDGSSSPETQPKDDLDFGENGLKIMKGQYLNIFRELIPLYPESNVLDKSRAFVNGHFDEEFYVRDGMFVKPKTDMPDGRLFSEDDYIGNDINAENFFSPGIKCTPGTSKIIW